MPQQKSKKIYLYIFLFFFIGTFNNKNLTDLNFFEINSIYVSGLPDEKNLEILKNLKLYEINNLFFLKKSQIKKLISSFDYVENYTVFKKYPSSLNIELSETIYLAYITKDDKLFYVGSNGKLIKAKDKKKNLPYIFGKLDMKKFFELKKITDKLNFNFKEIKSLYYFPSGRWDLEINSGILIKLSKDKLEKSLELSLAVLNDENFKNLKIIDVRQANQVIIDG